MRRRSLRFLWTGLLLLPAAATSEGGWAVITVEELPDHAVVGAPLGLEFTIRQHGTHRMDDLTPFVEATAGGKTVRARGVPAKTAGTYRASVTPPAAGDLEIRIASGFGQSNVSLLPIQAHASVARAVPVPDFERGRRLFVAKGCVTCHVHGDLRKYMGSSLGPELTGRRYTTDFLSKWLTAPPTTPTRGDFAMPDLDLDAREIAAITAFLNDQRPRHARGVK